MHNENQEEENVQMNKNEKSQKPKDDEAIQALKSEIEENDENPRDC
ncbi:hypothetical protein [Chengkuizengella sediminis]|nr:hypothetical protein [Chengkuizengella sediminis]NDI35860.1 hypothetical protein [Chengkuizengella sediminis]